MKKGFLYFIVFVVCISWMIQLYKKYSTTEWVTQVIRETKEVSLNEFISSYRAGIFKSIDLIDWTEVKWYQYLGTGDEKSIMMLNKTFTEEYYNVYQTKKPIDTSLPELGVSMTGKVIINVKYVTQSFLEKFMWDIACLLYTSRCV